MPTFIGNPSHTLAICYFYSVSLDKIINHFSKNKNLLQTWTITYFFVLFISYGAKTRQNYNNQHKNLIFFLTRSQTKNK